MAKTHVVVGGGSSGLFLCRRLLEKDDVILIERGENPPVVDTLFATITNELLNMFSRGELWPFTALITKPVPSRMYVTEPQQSFSGRQLLYAQGIGLGGTSNVNAMLYTPGSPLVFDSYWPKQWSSKVIEEALEHVAEVVSPSSTCSSGMMKKVMDNAAITDYKETLWDSNGVNSQYRSFINEDGCTRMNLCDKVLPVKDQREGGRLTIIRNATVSRVLFKGNHAISVLIRQAGGPVEGLHISPANGGEIILCAGVFETPRILMSSQISRGGLSSPNICEEETLPILPDLGLNLQDHVVVPYLLCGNWYSQWSIRFPSTSSRYRNRPRYPLNSVHGWVNLDRDGNVCDGFTSEAPACCQLLFVDGRILAGLVDQLIPRYQNAVYRTVVRPFLVYVAQTIMKFSLVQWILGYFFGILICLTQPHSRGKLSSDRPYPLGPLLVDPKYLSDDRDITILRNGLRTARELIVKTATQDKLRCVEVLPGPLFNFANRSDTFLSFASFFATTYFHACGTCSMSDGTSDSNNGNGSTVSGVKGVVGPDLKVHQVEGLRIADASVIPHIPNSPISVICMAIGDICGKLILNDRK